jgi:hypothetical protein
MNELSAAVTDTSGGWLATAQVDDQPDRRTFTSASGTRQRKQTEPSLSIERNHGRERSGGLVAIGAEVERGLCRQPRLVVGRRHEVGVRSVKASSR